MTNTRRVCLCVCVCVRGLRQTVSAVEFERLKITQYFFRSRLFYNRNQRSVLLISQKTASNIYYEDCLRLSTLQLAQR